MVVLRSPRSVLLSLDSEAKPESQLQLDGEVEVMDIKCGGGKNNLKSIPHPLASCHTRTHTHTFSLSG